MAAETHILDPMLRLQILIGLFVALMLWEVIAPRKALTASKAMRWRSHTGLIAINLPLEALLKFAVSILLLSWAATASAEHQIGLFNVIQLPAWVEIIAALIILDLAVWIQHWATHRIDWLWRLHRVHHVDRDIDVTTALRFHPIEIGLSMGYKLAVIIGLGVSPLAIILFELLLGSLPMFNHSNIRLPSWFDKWLRLFIVTPDMHRVHHSVHEAEHNHNYGFGLAIWDRIFGTYTDQPRDGHDAMEIGLSDWRGDEPSRFWWSVKFPFRD